MKRSASALGFTLLTVSLVFAQKTATPPMGSMDMPSQGTGSSAMNDMPGMNDGSADAMKTMEGHHMQMGAHMRMTALRQPKPGDSERAAAIVEAARKAALHYADYKVALADGYKIFLPNVPQKQYHFTNVYYTFKATRHFDPNLPPSLLYEKDGDGYKVVGVMYTAPKGMSEEELDERVPLSVAQWHVHVNFCRAPFGSGLKAWGPHSQFGPNGSITTRAACDAAGGTFIPQVFGWMVHVYPFEKTPEEIWAVEGHEDHMD